MFPEACKSEGCFFTMDGVMDEREFRACGRKKRYETRVEARKAAERNSRRKDAPKIFIYECPYCGGWHLTHHRPGR